MRDPVILLRLDERVPFELRLLNLYKNQPRNRRGEFLRKLLQAGFEALETANGLAVPGSALSAGPVSTPTSPDFLAPELSTASASRAMAQPQIANKTTARASLISHEGGPSPVKASTELRGFFNEPRSAQK